MQILPVNLNNKFSRSNTNSSLKQSKITFTSLSDIFTSSVAKTPFSDYTKSIKDLHHIDYSKLEGVQKNIEVFNGLSAKQIIKNIADLVYVPLVRGCANKCSHCFLSAEPPIVRSSFDDFTNLVDGIRQLNKNLGVNAHWWRNLNNRKYVSIFYDSDGSQIYLQGKGGSIHEFPELNKMLSGVTGIKGIFDTAGWSVRDKKTQARMERLVDYYSNTKNCVSEIHAINISINPFHSIYTKSLEYAKDGDFISSERLKQVYINRMANALFTFSPLFNSGDASIILRCFDDSVKGDQYFGVRHKDFAPVLDSIYKKFSELMLADLHGEQKNIKTKKDMIFANSIVQSDLMFCDTDLAYSGKILNYVGKDLKVQNSVHDIAAMSQSELSDYIDKKTYSVIDLNGKIYRANSYHSFDTGVQLNYKDFHDYNINFVP